MVLQRASRSEGSWQETRGYQEAPQGVECNRRISNREQVHRVAGLAMGGEAVG